MTVLGVGQQQAGEKRAQRHGHPHQFHQPRRAYHHQQGRGGRDFLDFGLGDDTEHWTQQIASANHYDGNAAEYAQAVIDAFASVHCMIGSGQKRHHGNQRDRRNVLKQENGERHPAVRAIQLFAFRQALQAEGRGRQGKAKAQNDRRVQRLVEGTEGDPTDDQTGEQHLRHAHAKHGFAHDP